MSQLTPRMRELAANGKLDPAAVEAKIAEEQAELAELHAKHDEAASVADDLWRQIISSEQRLGLLREVRAAIPAPECTGPGRTVKSTAKEKVG